MGDYSINLLEEALNKQASWQKQVELAAMVKEAKKALSDNLADSWRYHLGQKLIKLGEWLSHEPATRQKEA